MGVQHKVRYRLCSSCAFGDHNKCSRKIINSNGVAVLDFSRRSELCNACSECYPTLSRLFGSKGHMDARLGVEDVHYLVDTKTGTTTSYETLVGLRQNGTVGTPSEEEEIPENKVEITYSTENNLFTIVWPGCYVMTREQDLFGSVMQAARDIQRATLEQKD